MPEQQLVNLNSFAPDLLFTIGDSEEGLQRMLASAGMADLANVPRPGLIRWLFGRE